jgi:hypothetical protein
MDNVIREDSLPFVDIIIVNYGKGWLRRCLSSIVNTQYPRSKLEIIVVDNASGDRDLSLIENTFEGIRLIRLETNVGYAEAVNMGADGSKGEYIAVLNNDVIVGPEWLTKLVTVLQHDVAVAAVCPKKKSLYMTKTLDGCGGAFNVLGQGWDRGQYEIDVGQYSDFEEVINPSGAVFLTRRTLIDKFGFLLNPDFFIIFEDVDFGLRCWKAGYSIAYAPDCIVYHARGPSLGGLSSYVNLYLYCRNLLASMFEVFDMPFFLRLLPILVTTQLTQAVYLLFFHRKSYAVTSVLRGIMHFLLNLQVPAKRRAKIRTIFTKSDGEIVARFTSSLAVYEEARNHESLIKAFLGIINLYVRFVLHTQPIRSIVYLRKTPK